MRRLVTRKLGGAAAAAAVLACGVVLGLGVGTAVAAGGSPVGWGYNYSGQVGNGTTDTAGGCYCVATPEPLVNATNVVEMAAGYEFGLALRDDGTVLAWGYNDSGELGNGTTALDPVPRPVPGVTNAIAVAAGTTNALVLLANGTLVSWGDNQFGELALGTAEGPETCNANPSCAKRPRAVPGIGNAIAIAAYGYNGYALLADGTILAWGFGKYGALGNGESSTTPCVCASTPVVVPGESAVGIDAGSDGAADLLANTWVRNWGLNTFGQLGIGFSNTSSGCGCLGPVGPGGSTIRQVSTGGGHTLVLRQDGGVFGWGSNKDGELGIGDVSEGGCGCVPSPSPARNLFDVRKVESGDAHSTALLAGGGVVGWGNSEYGQVGSGSTDDAVPLPSMTPISGASDVTAGEYNSYAIVGPSQTLAVEFAGASTGSVGASGIVCSSNCAQSFAQGQTKVLRAVPSMPGQFAGWSGGGCSGTGTCAVRLNADQTVTATFGPPKGTTIDKLTLKGKRKKTARVRFSSPGTVTGFQCMLAKPKAKRRAGAGKSAKRKKPRFVACGSGKAYKKLKPGKYTFKVRALNSLGVEATPAKRVFRVKRPKKKS